MKFSSASWSNSIPPATPGGHDSEDASLTVWNFARDFEAATGKEITLPSSLDLLLRGTSGLEEAVKKVLNKKISEVATISLNAAGSHKLWQIYDFARHSELDSEIFLLGLLLSSLFYFEQAKRVADVDGYHSFQIAASEIAPCD